MKAYTDLEQSKKLAKILPLESADMFYLAGKGDPIFIGNKTVACGDDDYDALGGPDVLCWSLAALMEIIRTKSFNEQNVFFMGKTEPYCVFCGSECQTKVHNEPVDACYEMILKLNELNLL